MSVETLHPEARREGFGESPAGRSLAEEMLRLLRMEDAAARRRFRDAHALGLEERVEAGDCLSGLVLVRDDTERIVLRARENISRFREGDPATLGDGSHPARGLAVTVVDEDPVAGIVTLERDPFSRQEPLPGQGPFVLDRRDLSTGDRLARGIAQALEGRSPAGRVPARLLAGETLREPGKEEEAAAHRSARRLLVEHPFDVVRRAATHRAPSRGEVRRCPHPQGLARRSHAPSMFKEGA